MKNRKEIIKKLNLTSVGWWDILAKTILKGIAYHHSGLTDEERSIIEQGYRDGHLLLLAATSTLSTGINLPAKAVIFNWPLIGPQPMDITHYKQMSGRAGRTGFDTFGESVMFTDAKTINHVKSNLLKCTFDKHNLASTINEYSLRRVILEIIASTAVKSFVEIGIFLNKMLKVQLIPEENHSCFKWKETKSRNKSIFENDLVYKNDLDIKDQVDKLMNDIMTDQKDNNFELNNQKENNLQCLNWIYNFTLQILSDLKSRKFLTFSKDMESDTLLATKLGKACFASSVPPEEGEQLYWEIDKARLGLQLSSDLHLWYLVTSQISPLKEPQWK